MPISSTIMPKMSMSKPNLGMIHLSLMGWIAVGAAALILGLSVLLKIEKSSHASTKREYAYFVADVQAKGEAADKAARAQEAEDRKRKESADAEYKKLLADNAALKRMRDSRSSTSGVPETPSGSSRPDLICFDREAFKRAYGELVTEVRGLADEGTESAIGLDIARRWSQSR